MKESKMVILWILSCSTRLSQIPYLVILKVKRLIHALENYFPVNLKYLKKFELFVPKWKVILECENGGKIFLYGIVGALNVGQMFEFWK